MLIPSFYSHVLIPAGRPVFPFININMAEYDSALPDTIAAGHGVSMVRASQTQS